LKAFKFPSGHCLFSVTLCGLDFLWSLSFWAFKTNKDLSQGTTLVSTDVGLPPHFIRLKASHHGTVPHLGSLGDSSCPPPQA
jgi:hypothetical protein